MARSPQQQALRDRSKAIKNPIKGNKDSKYTLDKKDAGYYHVKYVPLRTSQVLNTRKVEELEDAANIQMHRPEVYEELEFRGHFERKDVRAIVLHDPHEYLEAEAKRKAKAEADAKAKAEADAKAKAEADAKAKEGEGDKK